MQALKDPWINGYVTAKVGELPAAVDLKFLAPATQGQKIEETSPNVGQLIAILKIVCEVTGVICPIIQGM